jgi:hypothetical protein
MCGHGFADIFAISIGLIVVASKTICVESELLERFFSKPQ